MGEVTEFCGVPGIGKTQLGIQLAVDVHLPSLFGGAEGEAVYIDTEGSFMPQRAVEIAEAFSLHVSKMANLRNDPALSAAANSVATDKILQSIHLFRIHDYVEQIAVIHTLPGFLDQHPKVKLVVIDSIAFHFRHNFEDFALRSRLLNGIAQRLTQIATDREIAGGDMPSMRRRATATFRLQTCIFVALMLPAMLSGLTFSHANRAFFSRMCPALQSCSSTR